MNQPDLFSNDPAMRMRDSKGRFATPLRAMADRAIEENKYLRLEVEKYKRAYLAAASMSSRYHRELLEVKNKLEELSKSYGNV